MVHVHSLREVTRVALRYIHARRKEKGVMLQKFCATTGYSPPYAAYLLRTYAERVVLGSVTLVPTRPSPWRRQRCRISCMPWREAGPRSRTKPGSLLALISVVSFRELSAASPGYVGADLVSHDGGKAAGGAPYPSPSISSIILSLFFQVPPIEEAL
jgi:hypothetical protein